MSLIGAAAIGAGVSLLGNILGKKSNDNANATNLKIAQMNNEWSEKMMQKQMDYNTAQWLRESAFSKQQAADANAFTEMMWNKTNEYNSAANQAARLREAGLNPALVMSGQNAGTASGASAAQAVTPSGNSVGLPSPSSASVRPYQFDFSGIGSSLFNALSMDAQIKKSDSESRFINMQADYYGAKTMAEIGRMYAETESHTAKTFYQKLLNQFGNSMMSQDYLNKIRQNQSLEVQIQNSIKQGVLMDKQIARYDEKTNAQIADLVASTAMKYSQGQLNKEQLKKVIMETKGLNLSNREKEAIFDYVVDKADADRFKGYTPWSIGADILHGVGNRITRWIKK